MIIPPDPKVLKEQLKDPYSQIIWRTRCARSIQDMFFLSTFPIPADLFRIRIYYFESAVWFLQWIVSLKE